MELCLIRLGVLLCSHSHGVLRGQPGDQLPVIMDILNSPDRLGWRTGVNNH